MDELAKVRRIIDKRLPGGSRRRCSSWMRRPARTAWPRRRAFHEAVGLTGIVLTKLDSTAKGGIVFAIEDALRVPVRFVGVGEAVGDLIPFDPDAFVAAPGFRLTRGSAPDRLVALDVHDDGGGLGQRAGRRAVVPWRDHRAQVRTGEPTGSPPRPVRPSGASHAVARSRSARPPAGRQRGDQLGHDGRDVEGRGDPPERPVPTRVWRTETSVTS